MSSTIEHLTALVGFKTVSRDSNTDLITYIAQHLKACGGRIKVLPGVFAGKSNLLASFGPQTGDGIILSGHSDVVPVDGQNWASDAFSLTERSGNFYGRGAVDMKGFIASVMHLASNLPALQKPLHIAISHDEEIGCVGVRDMLERLAAEGFQASGCVVGEPTGLQVAVGHKGKFAGCICCHGEAAHSANPGLGCNAIYLGAGMVRALQDLQTYLHDHGAHDAAYIVPYSTIHAGTIAGGTALNIVPDRCDMKFEIRFLPGDDVSGLMARLQAAADDLLVPEHARGLKARIEVLEETQYPGLNTAADHPFVARIKQAVGCHDAVKLGFGSEAGLFQNMLALPAVVCGPGLIDRAHRADEFIAAEELTACDSFLYHLVNTLS